MASSIEYINYVCEQIKSFKNIQFKKMFGDYMIYVNEKPILLVCDNITYVKELPEIEELMKQAQKGIPYEGAKEHYILDIDDKVLVEKIIAIIEPIIPLPRKRK